MLSAVLISTNLVYSILSPITFYHPLANIPHFFYLIIHMFYSVFYGYYHEWTLIKLLLLSILIFIITTTSYISMNISICLLFLLHFLRDGTLLVAL